MREGKKEANDEEETMKEVVERLYIEEDGVQRDKEEVGKTSMGPDEVLTSAR